ncbi:MAG: cysteine peptidase family C39 domain-containing protein [Methanobacterium sp.]
MNATEEELKILAGTDKTGTSMYGLAQAAKAKGLNAVGMMLSVNEVKPGNIVYYIYGDINHYSIFTSINDTTVYLRDTFRGNFEMALADFTSAYIQDTAINYGYALVVTSDLTDPQLNNSNTLTNDEMKTVVGTGSAISTWTTGNARIRGIANWVVANYGRDPYSIGRGIFNWVDANIRWHNHKNTQYSVDTVLNKGLGNCCEQARLVVCIARAAGIPYFDVRYVHRPSAGHVWAQIRYSSAWNGWVDIDCSWHGSYYGFYMDRAVWRPYPNEGRNYYYALPF